MTAMGVGRALAVLALGLALGACSAPGATEPSGERRAIVLAAATSTQDTGLLDVLVPAFERDTGRSVRTIATGSGQALELARRGEVDVVLAHSPVAERSLMQTGVAGRRRAVMHNDFILVGPPADPARARGRPVRIALALIAAAEATFVSRADDSGTHARELALWRQAGSRPRAPWYQETGQGQSATLQIAAERGGYALTDSATYLTSGVDRDLVPIAGGGPPNRYHVIELTARAGSRVNAAGGRALADWIVSDRAQELIAGFGRERFGRPLFVPAAAPAAPG